MQLFTTPVNSTVLITLTVVYVLLAAITTFDIRLLQARRRGLISPEAPDTPAWFGLFGYAMWLTWVVIFTLNWWYALLLFFLKFVLKVLPVLERIGGWLAALMIGKELPAYVLNAYAHQSREQKRAAKVLKNIKKGNDIREELDRFSAESDSGHSKHYWSLIDTLQKVKSGKAPDKDKAHISRQLIKAAELSEDEETDLLNQVSEVYPE